MWKLLGAQAGLELLILLPGSAGIPGVQHHTWLEFILFKVYIYEGNFWFLVLEVQGQDMTSKDVLPPGGNPRWLRVLAGISVSTCVCVSLGLPL